MCKLYLYHKAKIVSLHRYVTHGIVRGRETQYIYIQWQRANNYKEETARTGVGERPSEYFWVLNGYEL